MSNDNQYPYGYQLSFFERSKLRLKKINYRLSLLIVISFFAFGGAIILIEKVVPNLEFLYWRKILGSTSFLLLGFQGLIWAITGEMKKAVSYTYRGKSIVLIGIISGLVSGFVAIKILFGY
jgi:hypothetical protein